MSNIYGCLFLLLISCVSTQKPASTPATVTTEVSDFIVFLSLKITREPSSEKSKIDLISQKKVSGKVKNFDDLKQENHNSFLTIDVFDNTNNIVQTTIIEHPLYKRAEYSSENDNKLTTKSLTLQESSFFIRIPIKSNYTKIAISETVKKSNKKEIGIIIL